MDFALNGHVQKNGKTGGQPGRPKKCDQKKCCQGCDWNKMSTACREACKATEQTCQGLPGCKRINDPSLPESQP